MHPCLLYESFILPIYLSISLSFSFSLSLLLPHTLSIFLWTILHTTDPFTPEASKQTSRTPSQATQTPRACPIEPPLSLSPQRAAIQNMPLLMTDRNHAHEDTTNREQRGRRARRERERERGSSITGEWECTHPDTQGTSAPATNEDDERGGGDTR